MATIEKRSTGDGTATFRVKVRLKGHPAQTASFTRLTDARKWAQSTEAAIREGRHFKTSVAKRRTLGELIDRYIKDVLPGKSHSARHVKNQRSQLAWWKAELGVYSLAETTPALLAEKRDNLLASSTPRGEKRNPATVVRYMAALSHAFTIAMKEWGWIEDNPMRKVSRPREPRGRVRFLSDSERKQLLAACKGSDNPLLYPIVVLALATGMRQGEILSLRWPQVETNTGRIVLHETKNGERRVVPLVGHALAVVKRMKDVPRLDTDLVFPNRQGQGSVTFRPSWDKACTTAKLEDFRFHDLRHSAASYLAMNGASLAEIADVLGHKTLQMVKRYAHLSEAHTSAVVARMNESIFG